MIERATKENMREAVSLGSQLVVVWYCIVKTGTVALVVSVV